MSEIEVRLLGNPEVLWRGMPCFIERRNTRLLLYYLATLEKPISRLRLAELFWGRNDERSARVNLRQTLHRLRASFPIIKLLNEQEDLVEVNSDEVEVDLRLFTNGFSALFPSVNRLAGSQLLPDELYRRLLSLDRLWRGANLLGEYNSFESTELEGWFTSLNERLQPQRLWVLEHLCDYASSANNLPEALSFANRALINNPNLESLNRRLLMILLRMNRHAEAKETYKRLLRSLAQENLEPSAEFRLQFDSLIKPATRPRAAGQVTWNIYKGPEMPFVGRRIELDAINQQYLAGGSVFVFGESGLGKTRLLSTFAEQAYPLPRTILAQARAGEISLPYQSLVDALRRGVQPAEWLRLPGVWASHLNQLLPELSTIRSDIKPLSLTSPEQARALLQEALRQLFLMIAQQQHLLLVLDDAQWSDGSTLAALEYLVSRQPFDKHALLVIAARIEEPNPALQEMHLHMVKDQSVKTIILHRLNTEDIAHLAQSVLQVRTSSNFVDNLARGSGGNPLYIGEILSSLLPLDTISLESELLPISEKLSNLIQTRLRALSQDAQLVLEAASVLGYEFSLVELSGTIQYPPEKLSAALTELEERYLLRINPLQNEINKVRISFIHDKFREVQLQMISPVRLPLLHQQAANTIQFNAGDNLDESAAIIAQHYERAGDFLKAFDLWQRAGKRSLGLFSIIEADLAFNKAAEAVRYSGNQISEMAIFDFFQVWRNAHIARNNTSALKSLGEQLLILGQDRKSQLLLCFGHQTLADAAFTENNFQAGLGQIDLAMKDITDLDNRDLISGVFLTQGVLLLMTAQLPASKDALMKALSTIGDLQDADPETIQRAGDILYELGVNEMLSGWPDKGLSYALRALELHRKIQDQKMVLPSIVNAVSMIGLINHYLGRFPEGAKTCRDMLDTAVQAGAMRAVGYLHSYIALNELAMGNLDEMMFHAEQAIQIGKQYERKEIYTFAWKVIGDGLFWMQDFLEARKYYALALEQNQDTFLTPDFMTHLGYTEVALGNVEVGLPLISEGEKLCQNLGLGFFKEFADMAYSYYYAYTGKWEACKERLKQCVLSSGERGLSWIRVFAEYFLGISLIEIGELEHGIQLFRQVAHTAQSTQNFWAELFARRNIVLMMKNTGQEYEAEAERITALLAYLEVHTQNQFFRERYQSFQKNISQALDIPGLISFP